ncbi:MAG: hypothetical protein LBC23_02315, partial [Coriobacteriales bacterium]|nr:hypothetical protein [Coriobacteriales bacterium]
MTKVFIFGDVSYDYALKYEPMEDARNPYGIRAQHHRRWDVEESFTLKGGAYLLERLLDDLIQPQDGEVGLLSMTSDPRHRAISAWEGIPRVVPRSDLSEHEVVIDAENEEHIFHSATDDDKPKRIRRFFLKDYYGRILDDRIIRDDEAAEANRFVVRTADEGLLCASDIIVGYNSDRDNQYFSVEDDAEAPGAANAAQQSIPVLECLNASEGLERKVIVLRSTFARKQVPTLFLQKLHAFPRLIERTVLVLNVDELRHAGFSIEQGISWEKLVQQTVASLQQVLERYGDFLAIVVCFNHNGCLVYSKDEYKLFFYSSEIEGDLYPGASQTFGEVITLQAAIARELLAAELAAQDEDGAFRGKTDGALPTEIIRGALYRAARSGLVGIRKLMETGFVLKDYQSGQKCWRRSINRRVLEFPYHIVTNVLQGASQAQQGEVVAGLRLPAEVAIPIET